LETSAASRGDTDGARVRDAELQRLGGTPRLRAGFLTDNGNVIVDVLGLRIDEPQKLEQRIDGIAGVVTNGLFARRGADVLLLGTSAGVRESRRV